MITRHECARDVVLGFLDLLLHLPLEGGILPLGVRRIEDHGDLHAATRAMSRETVFNEMRSTRPPSSPTAGSSNIAVRRSPVRSDSEPMSGGASASPARCENSTNAPSTDACTAAGTTSRITATSGPLYQVYRKYVAMISGANQRRSSTSNKAAQTGPPSTKPAPETSTRP